MIIKLIPNMITISRIICCIALALLKPLSLSFFLVYFVCGATDILDGYIARKTNTASKAGAIIDSVADTIFISIMLIIFIPILPLTTWMIYWIIGVTIVRIISLIIGFIKYKALAYLHTYTNKATGLILFIFPIFFYLCGIKITAIISLTMASLSAIEEMIITIKSQTINRNIKSFIYIMHWR